MSMFSNRYYDVPPNWPSWRWSAYRRDMLRPIARGEAASRSEAEAAARACIEAHLREPKAS